MKKETIEEVTPSTMTVRRKAGIEGTNGVFEFIDFRNYADAEGTTYQMKAIIKEDNKKEMLEAIDILTKQVEDGFLQKEIEKFKAQVKLIEDYEANEVVAETSQETPPTVEAPNGTSGQTAEEAPIVTNTDEEPIEGEVVSETE